MGNHKVLVFDNKSEIANFMVKNWGKFSRDAMQKKGFFVAALSGGKTPLDFYRKLAEHRETFPWVKIHIFLVDERMVPFTDTDSNYGMLTDVLLSKVSIPRENCHRICVEESLPEISAEKYEEELRKFFGLQDNRLPEFDLIVLGIGKDGHTASLFPGNAALKDKRHLAIPVILDETRHNRITLTLPVINNAKNVVFLVSEKNKAPVIKEIIEEKDNSLPAAKVKPEKGNLLFLLDLEASAYLSAVNKKRIKNEDSPCITC